MKDPELQITARPKLPAGGRVPRAKPEAEYNRPRMPEPRVSLKRREEIDATAELDRICRPVDDGGQRPLKPPPLPKHNDTRTAGAAELAREIRRGTYTP